MYFGVILPPSDTNVNYYKLMTVELEILGLEKEGERVKIQCVRFTDKSIFLSTDSYDFSIYHHEKQSFLATI